MRASKSLNHFTEVLRDVIRRKDEGRRATAQQLDARLRDLGAKRSRLVGLVDRGVLDEETFQEQLEQNRAASTLVKRQLTETSAELPSVEEILPFAERVLADPGEVWEKANLRGRQRPPPLVPGQELSDFFVQVKWLAFGGSAVVALIVFVVVGRQDGSR